MNGITTAYTDIEIVLTSDFTKRLLEFRQIHPEVSDEYTLNQWYQLVAKTVGFKNFQSLKSHVSLLIKHDELSSMLCRIGFDNNNANNLIYNDLMQSQVCSPMDHYLLTAIDFDSIVAIPTPFFETGAGYYSSGDIEIFRLDSNERGCLVERDCWNEFILRVNEILNENREEIKLFELDERIERVQEIIDAEWDVTEHCTSELLMMGKSVEQKLSNGALRQHVCNDASFLGADVHLYEIAEEMNNQL